MNIKLVKGLFNKASSVFVHRAEDNFDKFVVLNLSIAIQVKGFECIFNVNIYDVNVHALDGFAKLLERKSSATVFIHLSELVSQID